MKQRRSTPPVRLIRTIPDPEPENSEDTVARLRRDRVIYDGVTGLPIHPFDDPERAHERIAHLAVIYLQIGKFFGFEELYGWELYDRVLVVVSQGLRADVEASRFAPHLYSIRYSGSDGFYVLYSMPAPGRGRGPSLENEAARLQGNAVKRLRTAFGGTAVDLMTVHASSLAASDNPRVRSSRHVVRQLSEAVKIVSQRQTREKLDLCVQLKRVIGQKQLRPAFQPLRHLADDEVIGWEALIRGPQGTPFERPNVLFAVAQENDMEVELETLCLETIFRGLPRAIGTRRLFVNASCTLLRHPVFLDERNLTAINRSHGDVVIEISEKEMVDYSSFGDILATVRGAGLKIAIDDAGSGYSGLEAILNLRPDYIKVADSLVRRLETDPIKREIITSLASIGRRIEATLVAEGIEREEEREALIELGVEYGQGFLLGRPAFQVSARA
ncbi:MAG TPA: EAL domain-containing protein [Thermoanaerobaculia bacterium]|nr:EAL domain-containing protein [Thermoanaerobaculia bacterium]